MILEAIPEIIPRLVFEILLVYAAVINFAAFAAYGVDKRRAKKDLWRIPEKTLFLLAVLGGSPGALLGMRAFRHKTRKKKFTLGVPIILVLQVVFCLVVWRMAAGV